LEKSGSSEFSECTGCFPLTSNLGAVPSWDWYVGQGYNQWCLSLSDSFGGVPLRIFKQRLFLRGGKSGSACWKKWFLQSVPVNSWCVSRGQLTHDKLRSWNWTVSSQALFLKRLLASAHY
jgi:hypothetical protein